MLGCGDRSHQIWLGCLSHCGSFTLSREPREDRKALLAQPGRIVERGEIAEAGVAQDRRNARSLAKLLAQRHRSRNIDARRQTKAQPLFGEQPLDLVDPLSTDVLEVVGSHHRLDVDLGARRARVTGPSIPSIFQGGA